jgi:hypothetical protein
MPPRRKRREPDRKFHWQLGRRPNDHPGLRELGH